MMGRVTWEGLPFPLPGRPNLVLTRNQDYMSPNAEIYNSINDLVGRGNEMAGELGIDEIMVVGGAKLYAEMLEYCDRLYVTDVHVSLSGDAHFPIIEPTDWNLSSERIHGAGPKDDHDFTIRIYDRK